MKRFRSTLFWLHLCCGLTAGLIIAVMCFTGTALAFQKSALAWAERDERIVTVPADAHRLTLRDLRDRVREASPDQPIFAVVVRREPEASVAFTLGRDEIVYANPYSGEIRRPATAGLRAFFRTMENWHRSLAATGDRRALGRAVTGAASAFFLVLAVSGLFLWVPRTWSWSGLRAVAVLNFRQVGRARDFNWHNSIGVWCAPFLIVLTLTALPMSYRWANNFLYRAVGSTPPDPPSGSPSLANAPAAPNHPTGARPIGLDGQFDAAERALPRWDMITLRSNGRRQTETSGAARTGPHGETHGEREAPPATVMVHTTDDWPPFANAALTLDAYSGEVLKLEKFADADPGRRLRTWARFLHTGEAFGTGGQVVAALAASGGCVLAFTGISLALRRFFGRRKSTSSQPLS